MELSTRVLGGMIFNMERELKHGQMDLDMKVNTPMEESMASEATNGMTVHSMQESGKRTRSQEWVSTHG